MLLPKGKLSPWNLTFLIGLGLFLVIFLVYPVVFMLRRGFGLEGEFTLKYFWMLTTNAVLRASLFNSVALATVTVLGCSLLVFPIAMVLQRLEFAGRSVLRSLLLVPMIMPPFVGAIGLKQLLARYGSINLFFIHLGWMNPKHPVDWLAAGGFWGVVILQVLSLYPILLLSVSAALANIDPALREAAQNLGAKGWGLFRTITLPLVLPGWFAGAIIVWIWSFTDLGTPLITGYYRVTAVQIFDAINDLNTNPQGFSLIVVVLVVSLGLFFVSQRLIGRRSYATLARGHAHGVDKPATPLQTAMIWSGAGALLLMALLPHISVVVSSFAGRWFLSVLPDSWTLDNYQSVFEQKATFGSIGNSFFYATASAGIDFVLGVGLGWMITRSKLKFAPILDAIAMLPLALPGLVLAFGYFAGFEINAQRHSFLKGMIDPRVNPTFLLIISYSIRRLPYMVRAACAGFQQTSELLEEASASFGATPLDTLRRITLPLISANLIGGFILTFAFAMLEVSDSLILAQQEGYFPITKQMWQLLGRIDPHAPAIACALGVIAMLLLMGSLAIAGRLMGRTMGQLFRA